MTGGPYTIFKDLKSYKSKLANCQVNVFYSSDWQVVLNNFGRPGFKCGLCLNPEVLSQNVLQNPEAGPQPPLLAPEPPPLPPFLLNPIPSHMEEPLAHKWGCPCPLTSSEHCLPSWHEDHVAIKPEIFTILSRRKKEEGNVWVYINPWPNGYLRLPRSRHKCSLNSPGSL